MDAILVLALPEMSLVVLKPVNLPPVIMKVKPMMKETLSVAKMDVIHVLALLEKLIVLLTFANQPPVITKVPPIMKEILSIV
jgi:hypothetical protein